MKQKTKNIMVLAVVAAILEEKFTSLRWTRRRRRSETRLGSVTKENRLPVQIDEKKERQRAQVQMAGEVTNWSKVKSRKTNTITTHHCVCVCGDATRFDMSSFASLFACLLSHSLASCLWRRISLYLLTHTYSHYQKGKAIYENKQSGQIYKIFVT